MIKYTCIILLLISSGLHLNGIDPQISEFHCQCPSYLFNVCQNNHFHYRSVSSCGSNNDFSTRFKRISLSIPFAGINNYGLCSNRYLSDYDLSYQLIFRDFSYSGLINSAFKGKFISAHQVFKHLTQSTDASKINEQTDTEYLMKKIKIHERKQAYWLSAALATAVAGGFFNVSADHKYNEYLVSTNSQGAAKLYNTVEVYDIISPVLFGISGLCILEFTYHTIQKNSARKKLQFQILGQSIGFTMSLD